MTASLRDVQSRRAPPAPGVLLRDERGARNPTQPDFAARPGPSA